MYNNVSYLLWEHRNKYEKHEMNIEYSKIFLKQHNLCYFQMVQNVLKMI